MGWRNEDSDSMWSDDVWYGARGEKSPEKIAAEKAALEAEEKALQEENDRATAIALGNGFKEINYDVYKSLLALDNIGAGYSGEEFHHAIENIDEDKIKVFFTKKFSDSRGERFFEKNKVFERTNTHGIVEFLDSYRLVDFYHKKYNLSRLFNLLNESPHSVCYSVVDSSFGAKEGLYESEIISMHDHKRVYRTDHHLCLIIGEGIDNKLDLVEPYLGKTMTYLKSMEDFKNHIEFRMLMKPTSIDFDDETFIHDFIWVPRPPKPEPVFSEIEKDGRTIKVSKGGLKIVKRR